MTAPEFIPVIVGVGEIIDRPRDVSQAQEPVALMAEALQAAEVDSGGQLLSRLDSLDLVGLISWPYADPVSDVAKRLGLTPARLTNASMGGETPIRLIHDAALRIAKGEQVAAAIVGGEAMNARGKARKEKATLNWTPKASKEEAVVFPSSRYAMNDQAKALGMMDPAQVYPFYEMATQKAWGQTPAEANSISADLWARYAKVAQANEKAWIRTAPSAETIGTVSDDNRLINWPYPKLMVANPAVNQAAAIIVTSLAVARDAGVPEDRIIHIHGGAAAAEAEDYLLRDSYERSSAQDAVLGRAVEIAGGASSLTALELYSCFPVVPKMALKALGPDVAHLEPTVAGGLTFFGGPLNNYMSHAVCAMVRKLRANTAGTGLLYGQGGYVNKHHALVVSAQNPKQPLASEYSVQGRANSLRGETPSIAVNYAGPATIETYTVRFARDGQPLEGVVIARTSANERLMARVPTSDNETMALLLSREASAVGTKGLVRTDAFGKLVFEAGEAPRERVFKYTQVEREGPLTIVTINRPDSMNSLHPAANAELAEIFDAFAADPEQWVAILTGAGGKAFSSGNDLKWTAVAMARGQALETPVRGFAGLTARFDLDKPVIAAVEGVAMGGGFEIALACDLIIAGENATFALPEPKVGLAALAGGLLRLPRQIGLKQAMGMILTGRRVKAAEGERLGFVNEVVADGEALAGARRWAELMLECSPMSLRASKQILQRGLDVTVEEAAKAQDRYPATKALFRSADVREGPAAFAQKRKPQWKGR